MNNLKDTITTIAGLAAAIGTSLLAVEVLPESMKIAVGITVAVCVAIIGYFNGKTADGKVKSSTEILEQEKLNS